MVAYDYDLFVIGAGSGGVRAARMAAAKGIRVAIADDKALGGTCVNVGCVPKKLYTYASHYGHAFEEAKGFGWSDANATFDWSTLVANKQAEISRLNGIYQRMLDNAKVDVLRGFAQLVSAHEVAINGTVYTCERILIATGGKPTVPKSSWSEYVVTSDQIFDLPSFPQRLLVIGAGYIALEFACVFNGLGSEVHVSYRGNSVLRGFDADVREFMDDALVKQGINMHFETNVTSIVKTSQGLQVTFDTGATREVDEVLMAVGRTPKFDGLGLEAVGIKLDDRGMIPVDQNFTTQIPSIFALGDITAGPDLTPVALAEAMALVDHLYGTGLKKMDYANIPTAVFTHPNIGTVGLSEAEARAVNTHVDVYFSEFRPLKHTLSGSNERSMMKMVVDRDTDQVLGIHIVAEGAGEIMQGFGVALKAGATKVEFDQTIGIHPTAAEELVTMRIPRAPSAS